MPHCGPPHRCVGQCIRRGGRRFEGREASHDWIGRVIAPNDIALNLVDDVANRFANLPKQKGTGHHVDNEIALGADLVRVNAEQMFERSVQRHRHNLVVNVAPHLPGQQLGPVRPGDGGKELDTSKNPR